MGIRTVTTSHACIDKSTSTVETVHYDTVISGRSIIQRLINFATIAKDFIDLGILHTGTTFQRLHEPSIGRCGIHDFPLVVLRLGLETRVDYQARGIHRLVLARRGEIDMPAQHLGVSFVQTKGIIVDFVQSSKDAFPVYFVEDFNGQVIQLFIPFSVGIISVTCFTSTA